MVKFKYILKFISLKFIENFDAEVTELSTNKQLSLSNPIHNVPTYLL
jgi:hypothetical protein